MHLRTTSLLLLTIVLLGSCTPVYYKPNRVNAPMLTDAGQVQFCLSPSNAQVAFSPLKHLGLMGNYAGYRTTTDNYSQYAHMFELGAGYYGLVDTPKHRDGLKIVYDIYGGFGAGRIDIRNQPNYYYPDATLKRVFVQPGIGFRGRVVEASFNCRVSNISYSNFSAPPVYEVSPYEGSNYFVMEPAITVRVGYKAVKGEIQYVYSTPFSNVEWNYVRNTLNVGVAVILGGYR